jgi:hypothetical protein
VDTRPVLSLPNVFRLNRAMKRYTSSKTHGPSSTGMRKQELYNYHKHNLKRIVVFLDVALGSASSADPWRPGGSTKNHPAHSERRTKKCWWQLFEPKRA